MTELNPYQAPQTDTNSSSETLVRAPRSVTIGRAPAWIVESTQLFARAPTSIMVVMIVYTVITMLPVLLTAVAPSLAIAGQILNAVIAGLLFGGIVLGFHWLAEGKGMPLTSLLGGFATRPGALVALAVCMVIFAALAIAAGAAIGGFPFAEFQQVLAAGDEEMLAAFLNKPELGSSIFWLLICFIPVMMAFAFAYNLVVLSNTGILSSILQSFNGVLRNLHVFVLAGILFFIIVLIIVTLLSLIIQFAILIFGQLFSKGTAELLALPLQILLSAALSGFAFGINYAAFRDIYMHKPVADPVQDE